MKKRISRNIPAAVLLAAIFIACSTAPIMAETPVSETVIDTSEIVQTEILDNSWSTDGSRQYNSISYNSLDENEKQSFDAIVTDANGKRLFLWNVTHEIIDVTYNKDEDVFVTVEYGDLYEKDVPKTYTYTNPLTGTEHVLPLISSDYTDSVITGRTGFVKAMIEYGWQSYIPKPLEQIEITHLDEKSGEEVTGLIDFKELVLEKEFRWLADVIVPAVFEVYEAEYYKMEDAEIYVPYNNSIPEIQGQERDIIVAIDQNPERLRINGSEWTSGVYNEGGVDKRDALLTGDRYVARYIANYESEWELPDAPGFNCIAVYGNTIDVLNNEIPMINAVSTAEYRPITRAAVITLIGAAIAIAALVIVLIIIAKRRKKKREAEDASGFIYEERN